MWRWWWWCWLKCVQKLIKNCSNNTKKTYNHWDSGLPFYCNRKGCVTNSKWWSFHTRCTPPYFFLFSNPQKNNRFYRIIIIAENCLLDAGHSFRILCTYMWKQVCRFGLGRDIINYFNDLFRYTLDDVLLFEMSIKNDSRVTIASFVSLSISHRPTFIGKLSTVVWFECAWNRLTGSFVCWIWFDSF